MPFSPDGPEAANAAAQVNAARQALCTQSLDPGPALRQCEETWIGESLAGAHERLRAADGPATNDDICAWSEAIHGVFEIRARLSPYLLVAHNLVDQQDYELLITDPDLRAQDYPMGSTLLSFAVPYDDVWALFGEPHLIAVADAQVSVGIASYHAQRYGWLHYQNPDLAARAASHLEQEYDRFVAHFGRSWVVGDFAAADEAYRESLRILPGGEQMAAGARLPDDLRDAQTVGLIVTPEVGTVIVRELGDFIAAFEDVANLDDAGVKLAVVSYLMEPSIEAAAVLEIGRQFPETRDEVLRRATSDATLSWDRVEDILAEYRPLVPSAPGISFLTHAHYEAMQALAKLPVGVRGIPAKWLPPEIAEARVLVDEKKAAAMAKRRARKRRRK